MDVQEWKLGKDTVMVNMVSKEAEILPLRPQERSTVTKWHHGEMGFPLIRYSKNMVHYMLISNCTILPDDVTTANNIYSSNVHFIKEKTMQNQPTSVLIDSIAIPPEFLNKHGDVMMTVEVM